MPKGNLKEAQSEVNLAQNDGAKAYPLVNGVTDLSQMVEIIFQPERDPAMYAEKLFEEAENSRLSHDYDNAMRKFNELIIHSREYLDDYPAMGRYIPESLYRIGIIHLHYGKIHEAKEYYEKAESEYLRQEKIIRPVDLANFYNSYSVYALDVYDFCKALELTDKSLEIKRIVYPEYEIMNIGSYNQKGQVFTFSGEFEKAEKVFMNSIRIAEEQGKGGEQDLDRIRNYLGMLYIRWANLGNMSSKFRSALECLEPVLRNSQSN